MGYRMHPKQIENIFSLTPKQRYEHFVSKVCNWEELWILEDEQANYLILTPQENLEYLPVWPHADYAASFLEVYPSFTPTKVDLNNFIKKWLQILNDDGIKIGVLPNLDISVWIIDPLDLKEELENELKQYK